jgi:hypothetical protein
MLVTFSNGRKPNKPNHIVQKEGPSFDCVLRVHTYHGDTLRLKFREDEWTEIEGKAGKWYIPATGLVWSDVSIGE